MARLMAGRQLSTQGGLYHMKMYLISDNVDTYTGMRLAGVDGVVVHKRDELKKALEDVLSDKTVGIVLLTEKFGREFPDIIEVWPGFPRHSRYVPAGEEDASPRRNPRPSRNRTPKGLYHIIHHRGDRIKTVKGGIPLDIRRKNRSPADLFHGAGPRGGQRDH